MGIQKLDQQRKENHKEFIKKPEDFLSEFMKLMDQLVKITNELETKKKFLINETYKAYKLSYYELQETIHSVQELVSSNKTIDEIVTISKSIYGHLIRPQMPTNNDHNGQM